MQYNINLGAWNSIFAVPCALVDEHIRMAGSAQLKVLLYLLRYSGQPLELSQISSSIGLPEADIFDALNYWIDTELLSKKDGVLSPSGAEAPPATEAVPASKPVKAASFTPSQPTRPTHEECSKMLETREDIRHLLREAQNILGAVIKRGDVDILVSIPDWTGIPADVLLMIISYCVSIGKKNISYIEKVAISWAEAEIDTVEKADKKLFELSTRQNAWRRVRSIFGIAERRALDKEAELCNIWLNEWRFTDDMLKLAYERCITSAGKLSFAYINKILDRWQSEGIFTPKDAELENPRKISQKEGAKGKGKRKASYDISEIEKLSLRDTLEDWGDE
ncbi:MAG: DnaD domain protein [Oscillospiraceae bacterium]|nr:DnaD domain protein [Oscillospiraceae bacterium]